ncbi:probable serine/threonine-protein phosphatase 2A regulatory subunit B'' subunit TON2 isoform X1 [Physcomitrium patens]|uniref:Uncharacterized protein n=2 Tax=Physcomitrium patens TaxID=3218 RepID=A0A7I4FQQ4_PHYPA|nr:probable serine/threonine-protein phosphatase 2A regulatory subunit B'' subunit TON2 isoform X1 [Physcomitrium patens]|eukprot:XP_024376623.1 probable serine/threonine-protein phosphatase 2A regulatory subunit B'' subunit TON2 isoform X1 [Physcomitrella patens]
MEATDEFLRFEETMDFHKTELRRPEMRCRGPLPSSMLWVDQLRKCDGSGDGLGSEAAKGAGGLVQKPVENSAGMKVQRLAKYGFLRICHEQMPSFFLLPI